MPSELERRSSTRASTEVPAAIAAAPMLPTGFSARALYAGNAYWFAMFVASVLGTNLGDLWVHDIFHDRIASFASLVVICGLAIWQDRRLATRSEAAYWIAIVGLRAAATNLADYLTHDLALGFFAVTLLLGVLALGAARLTMPDPSRGGAPKVDTAYWIAMGIAGVFGTTGGDMVWHTIGLYPASVVFCLALATLIGVRNAYAPVSVLLYWCIVLAERCSGTAVGNSLANVHALGLGLPIASTVSIATLMFALWARARAEQA